MEQKIDEILRNAAECYAWSNDTIGVNKETFETKNVPLEKMVRIPVYEYMLNAFVAGAVWGRKDAINNATTVEQSVKELKNIIKFH